MPSINSYVNHINLSPLNQQTYHVHTSLGKSMDIDNNDKDGLFADVDIQPIDEDPQRHEDK